MDLKLLEENVGKKICNTGLGNDFGHDTRSTNDKNTKNKRDYIKLKSFFSAKETLNKMKRLNGRKYLQTIYQIWDWYLKYTRKPYNLTRKKTNNPILKWAGEMNSLFFKKVIKMANRSMKTCLISHIIRKCIPKPHRGITWHLLEWLSSKRQENCWYGKCEPYTPVVGI